MSEFDGRVAVVTGGRPESVGRSLAVATAVAQLWW